MGRLYGQSVDTTSPIFVTLTSDPAILGQWIQLCLSTDAGSIWTSPEYGFDLRTLLLKPMTPDALAILPAQIAAALEFDERIDSADVAVVSTFTANGGAKLKFSITVTPKGASGQPFVYTGTATAAMVTIMLQGTV